MKQTLPSRPGVDIFTKYDYIRIQLSGLGPTGASHAKRGQLGAGCDTAGTAGYAVLTLPLNTKPVL